MKGAAFVVSPSNHERSVSDGPVLSDGSPFDGLRANGGVSANEWIRGIRRCIFDSEYLAAPDGFPVPAEGA